MSNEFIEQFKEKLTEEFGRGIPDYVMDDIAKEMRDSAERVIKQFVNISSHTPAERRQKLQAANVVLDELEDEAGNLIREKMSRYLRTF